jgi:hypothetical protein
MSIVSGCGIAEQIYPAARVTKTRSAGVVSVEIDVREQPYAAVMLRTDEAFEELAAIDDAEELCRRLLASPSAWRSSTRHQEAIELLTNVCGTSELPGSFVALMVCTCQRWDRVTARLIMALEESGLLEPADLDELAESLLSHEQVIFYPLAWVSPDWLELDLDTSDGRTYTIDEHTLAQHRLRAEPPLRRWAAQRALRADPGRLQALLRDAELFEPRHRDAVIHGLLDATDALDEPRRRGLIDRGLRTGRASVRLTALDRLSELDGPEAARRAARAETNATVRNWRPAAELTQPTLL